MRTEELLSHATVEKVRVDHQRLSRDEIVGLTIARSQLAVGEPLWIFSDHATHPFYWAATSPVIEILQKADDEIEVMTESRSIYRIKYSANEFEPTRAMLERMHKLIESGHMHA